MQPDSKHTDSKLPDAPQAIAAVKATALNLSKHINIEQAFQCIAENCLMHMQGNEVGVRQGNDAESVHQMRVALRRLRSAFSLFKNVLHVPADLLREFDWLGEQLGNARDWDVLFSSTIPKVTAEIGAAAEFVELNLAVENKVRDMHNAASEVVSSPRYTSLISKFSLWLQECAWRGAMWPKEKNSLADKVERFAHKTLAHDQHRLSLRGRKLHSANPQARHRVRIAAKKARYATEFFQSLFPSGRVAHYLKTLSTLQDELGWLNDAAIAARLLNEVLDGQEKVVESAAYIRGYLAGSARNDDRKILKLWNRVKSVKRPG